MLLLQASDMRCQLESLVIVTVAYARVHQLWHFEDLQQLSMLLQCEAVGATSASSPMHHRYLLLSQFHVDLR